MQRLPDNNSLSEHNYDTYKIDGPRACHIIVYMKKTILSEVKRLNIMGCISTKYLNFN